MHISHCISTMCYLHFSFDMSCTVMISTIFKKCFSLFPYHIKKAILIYKFCQQSFAAHVRLPAVIGVERAQTVSKKDSATANIRKVSGGFGRLKTQKIKALVNRAYQVKQEADEPNYEPDLEITRNKPGSSDSKLGYTRKMKKVTNFDRTEEEMDHSDEDVNYDIEHEIDPDLSQRYETNQAGSKASNGSASNLRGWGGGRSKQRSEYEPKDTSKQRKKFSVDSGFFSRKSFKDLGCSESVMKALEAQLYTRASHIQVICLLAEMGENYAHCSIQFSYKL